MAPRRWLPPPVNWVVSQTFSHSDAEYLEAAKLCIEKGNDVTPQIHGFTASSGANRGLTQ
jgi:hypothetical protein